MVNAERVEQLVAAALAGMEMVPDFNGADLTSAGFTLCARLISVALVLDPAAHVYLRQGVEQLMMRCADPTKLN